MTEKNTAEKPQKPKENEKVRVVSDKGLYVRSEPKKVKDNGNVVRTAQDGEELEVVKRNKVWLQVVDGYVMAEFTEPIVSE